MWRRSGEVFFLSIEVMEGGMISIRKYLDRQPGRVDQALVRMSQRLLEGVRQHSIQVVQEDSRKFRSDISNLAERLAERPSASKVEGLAESAVELIEDYNGRTARIVRAERAQLEEMIAMLSGTISRVGAASERSVSQLEAIEQKLRKTTVLENILEVKSHLSRSLDLIREEARRQKEESSKTVSSLKQQLRIMSALPQREAARPSGQVDPVTYLPDRAEAETAVAKTIEQESHMFAVVFVCNRVSLFNARYGRGVGDQILLFVREYLSQSLASNDLLFRWSGPAFVALVERPGGTEKVRVEVQDFSSVKLEKSVTVDGREITLVLRISFTALPMFLSPSAAALIRQIDLFVEATQHQPENQRVTEK